MAKEIKMPQLGLTMEEGTIMKWFKNEGDVVTKGEPLLEINTDKLTNQIESERDGVLLKIIAQKDEDIKVGGILGYVGDEGEEIEYFEENMKSEEVNKNDYKDKKKDESSEKHIVVIGGGPGGYVAAIRAAQLGAKVTLIEKKYIGGTCLNVGCIPTKSLLHSADIYTQAKNAANHGINLTVQGIDWGKVQSRKQEVVDQLVNGVGGLLQLGGVDVIEGAAEFVDSKTIKIVKEDQSTEELKFDRVIIASGSVPAIPPIPGVKENDDCIDSTAALNLEEIPDEMVVIGGGVIGIELASLFSQFGTKVTVLEAMPKLLPMMDEELTGFLRKHLESNGVKIMTDSKVTSVEKKDGKSAVSFKHEGSVQTISANKVLVAVGRRANTDALKLDRTGIKTEKGKIIANDMMETNLEGIYAIGDCLGKTMLAHIASAQGEIAAENAMGQKSIYEEKTNPSCVFTSLEFAGVGLTEAKAKELGKDIVIGKFPMTSNGKALIENNGDGLVKIILGKEYKEVLGVHILGPRATDVIGEAALAIGMEATVEDVIATIHSHPTITEAVREAALATEGRAIHKPN